MLCNYLPCNSIIYTVLEEHCLVYSVRISKVGIATVCLWNTSNLQNKHDFAVKHREKRYFQYAKSIQTEIFQIAFPGLLQLPY